MKRLREQIEGVRVAFERLSQREQLLVLACAAAVGLVVVLGVGFGLSNAISKAEHRVKIKTDQLGEVLRLQGEYRARQRDREQRLRELGRSKVRLVSVVEEAARNAGVNIGQLRPEDGEPNADGVVESRVDLRAQDLSADRLQEFLSRLEKAPGGVSIRRLQVDRPYRKDTVNVEMTIVTYQMKAQGT